MVAKSFWGVSLGLTILSMLSLPQGDSAKLVQQTSDPVVTFRIGGFSDPPVALKKVWLGDKELLPESTFAATEDWLKHLRVEGISRSDKTIAYLSYAIDITFTDENEVGYRIKLDAGRAVFLPPADQYGDSLKLGYGQPHTISFADKAWDKYSAIIKQLNGKRMLFRQVKVFVETVAFEDDTMWVMGSLLRRSKSDPSSYERVSGESKVSRSDTSSLHLARGFLGRSSYLSCTQGVTLFTQVTCDCSFPWPCCTNTEPLP
jgi:hypothetical protein